MYDFKNKFKFIISFFIVFILVFNIPIYADEVEEDLDFVWLQEEISKTKTESATLNIQSKSAIAYDRSSKTVLFGKNENQKVKMASTTKIMTAIVFLENVNDLNQTVNVCKEAASIGGSRLGLKTNDQITYNDLLYGLLLCSGNDCAIQISVSVSGSVDEFVKLMNNKAEELELKNTHFMTPHGLDQDEHYTTAFELAKITDYALNIEKIKEVVNTKTYTVSINGYSKTISNTNELLGYLDGVNGVKTGFTNGAGRCLVTSVNRDNFNIITVILGADTKKIRTKDSINLIEYVYSNYELINLREIIEEEFKAWKLINENRIYINKGIEEKVDLKINKIEYNLYPIKIDEKDNASIEINSLDYIEAPVLQNELIGEINVKINEKFIGQIDIVSKKEIRKKNMWDYFKICLTSIF